jgi:hypothetical protein
MWSRKPTPVAIRDRPSPSMFTETETSVSVVLRTTLLFRIYLRSIADLAQGDLVFMHQIGLPQQG